MGSAVTFAQHITGPVSRLPAWYGLPFPTLDTAPRR